MTVVDATGLELPKNIFVSVRCAYPPTFGSIALAPLKPHSLATGDQPVALARSHPNQTRFQPKTITLCRTTLQAGLFASDTGKFRPIFKSKVVKEINPKTLSIEFNEGFTIPDCTVELAVQLRVSTTGGLLSWGDPVVLGMQPLVFPSAWLWCCSFKIMA
jgi:hypothetical protein